MREDSISNTEKVIRPVWFRPNAFPVADRGYGWLDKKYKRYFCNTADELAEIIRCDLDAKVELVWSPQSPYCQIPEELAVLEGPIYEIKNRWVQEDYLDALHRLKTLGTTFLILLAYITIKSWYTGEITKSLTQSSTLGIAAMVFLVFAFIPWYQARKRIFELREHKNNTESSIPLIRFETWLDHQKAPVTSFFLVLLSVVFLAQVYYDKAFISFHASIDTAGLVKEAYKNGEYWRLFTSPLLHGGLVHFVMNMLGLMYLGKRLEVFARWPHLVMVFLFSALVGGEATARLMDAHSVGASGGLMGWLGFLLIFESLHSNLVPKTARKRLIGGLLITALIGVLGYRFIDNAAHFGGLIAGMAYAALVFPMSNSVIRPKTTTLDRILGAFFLLVILGSVICAISVMQ